MPLARSATRLSLSHAAAQPAATAGSDAAAPMASQAPRPISFRRIKPIEAAGSPSTPPAVLDHGAGVAGVVSNARKTRAAEPRNTRERTRSEPNQKTEPYKAPTACEESLAGV